MALTDTNIHAPPVGGAFDYDTFVPPALAGGTYAEPVFLETVRKYTNIGAVSADNNAIYAFHNINADGTLIFHDTPASQLDITDTTTGTVTYSNQPISDSPGGAGEVRWHMTDRNKYCYWSGANLIERNLSLQTNTTLHTFPATLEVLGGSANYWDRTQRYALVAYKIGGLVRGKIWDSQTNTIYSGDIPLLNWSTISPDGSFIVTQADSTPAPSIAHYSYAINHGTQSVSTTPNQYWGIGGDHGAVVSCSDGKTRGVLFDNDSVAGVYAVDVTTNNAGKTTLQQEASGTLLLPLDFHDIDGFICPVSVTNIDWVFTAVTANDDTFSARPSPWRKYSQEIIAINVVTGALRRLAHHRSRSNATQYWNNPFIGCSPTGSMVDWMSNMNSSVVPANSNLFGIANPLGSTPDPGFTPPPPPALLGRNLYVMP